MITEKTAILPPSPWLEGVRQSLESFEPRKITDGLSDTYLELCDIATMNEQQVKWLKVNNAERDLTLPEIRRAKVVRRLGILSFKSEEVNYILESHDLLDEYQQVVDEIALMYQVKADEISDSATVLRHYSHMRPWYLQ